MLLALDYARPDNPETRVYAERRAWAHGMTPYVTTWDLQTLAACRTADGPLSSS